jgi:hypothetical protein
MPRRVAAQQPSGERAQPAKPAADPNASLERFKAWSPIIVAVIGIIGPIAGVIGTLIVTSWTLDAKDRATPTPSPVAGSQPAAPPPPVITLVPTTGVVPTAAPTVPVPTVAVATPAPSEKCKVLSLDGTKQQHMIVENIAGLNLSSFTVEMSIMPAGSQPGVISQLIARNYGKKSYESFGVFLRNDKTLQANTIISVSQNPDENKNGDLIYVGLTNPIHIDEMQDRWYHIAFVVDLLNQRQRLYINGGLAAEGFTDRMPVYDRMTLTIGAESENNNLDYFYSGKIDEVRLWSVARLGHQIYDFMNKRLDIPKEKDAGKDKKIDNLAAYYRFDGSGSDVLDLSGNKHDGKLQNEATRVDRECLPVATLP